MRSVRWLLATAFVVAGCAPRTTAPTLEAEAKRIGAPLVGEEGAPSERAHVAILIEPDGIVVDQHGWQAALRGAGVDTPEVRAALSRRA